MSLTKNSKEPNNSTLLTIVGPTASGKTALSINLAKKLGGEIISADSLQIFKDFDIGSAKPDKQQLKSIKHHLVGSISPKHELNAFEYSNMARKAIDDVLNKGCFPILVGGSGLYIRAVIDGLLKVEGSFDGVKENILREKGEKGLAALYQELIKSDPETATKIHFNDEMRIVRALELYRVTGTARKEVAKSSIPINVANIYFIGLNPDRKELYARIDNRVDKMVQDGLIEEVKAIIDKYGYEIAPLNGLGYRQFTEYIKSNISLEQAIYLTKMHTRHYAKRQITWFKKDARIKWFDGQADTDSIIESIIQGQKEGKWV